MERDWNWRNFKSEIFYRRRIKDYFDICRHNGVWINEIKHPLRSWLDFIGTKEALKFRYQNQGSHGERRRYSGPKEIWHRRVSKKRGSLGDRNLDKIEMRKIVRDYESW